MSFPSTGLINTWFQDAHTTALAAGGSVYVMEKRAEQEVVSSVLRWACLTMLDELEDLNYPTSSTEDEEFVDDCNDEEDDEDEDATEDKTTKESEINLNTCTKGQKLKLRNREIVSYEGPFVSVVFPHKAGGSHYTSKGKYYADGEQSQWDIVEILPLEDKDTSEESSIEVGTDLVIEIVGALLKAITSK